MQGDRQGSLSPPRDNTISHYVYSSLIILRQGEYSTVHAGLNNSAEMQQQDSFQFDDCLAVLSHF
jgi:hypothetical protein